MRLILFFVLLPLQAQAWTFTPGQICRLSHETAEAKIELTFDPGLPLYSLTISRNTRLPQVEPFVMRFIGPAGRVISTDRHEFAKGGTSMTVKDSGFGNVLDGLQFNQTAEAILGDTTLRFPLEKAANAVAAFRKCEVSAGV